MVSKSSHKRQIRYYTLLSLVQSASAIRYYPNGAITQSDVACSEVTTESACCSVGYVCLSNGIYMQTYLSIASDSESSYVRGSCTDQTWRSSFCPNFCVNSDAPYLDDTAGGEGMAKCPNSDAGSYYCVDFDQSAVNCTTGAHVIKFQGEIGLRSIRRDSYADWVNRNAFGLYDDWYNALNFVVLEICV